MIRPAGESDLDDIMRIVESAVEIMAGENNPQWGNDYPLRTDFENDISQGSLYVFEDGGRACAMICVNGDEPAEYAGVSWRKNFVPLVIHRMSVLPRCRGKGVAKALLEKADGLARESNGYIRTDTFSGNVKMNALLVSRGFVKTGEINFPGISEKFVTYDKIL